MPHNLPHGASTRSNFWAMRCTRPSLGVHRKGSLRQVSAFRSNCNFDRKITCKCQEFQVADHARSILWRTVNNLSFHSQPTTIATQ